MDQHKAENENSIDKLGLKLTQTITDPPALRQVVSNEEHDHRSGPRIDTLRIPKNRSTGDLLSQAGRATEDGKIHISFDGTAGRTRSPIVSEHEHGLGVSGLRRIRQRPPSRAFSRAPTVPSSPTTPYALPTRSASMTLGSLPSRDFASAGPSSPTLSFTEDLTRFPSESLHSFSFAHQSEDALHNRQSVLKRAIDFMRDRLGWGANHPGVMSAQAKISGDAELQSMVELLLRAKVVGNSNQDSSSAQLLNGPFTGPADTDGDVFEKAFRPSGRNSVHCFEGLYIDEPSRQSDDTDQSRPSSSHPAPSLGSETSIPDVAEPQSPPQIHIPPRKTGLRRTNTDVSLLNLQTKLVEALAQPYKASDVPHDHHHLLSPAVPQIPAKAGITGINTPSLVHGHNNRWVPAAQAIFTTEASSPWTIMAANDLACLVFGVTKGEVKRLGMLEVVREDRRAWLEDKLKSSGSGAVVKTGHKPTQSARTSPKRSLVGGGITASLLSKPSWREQRAKTGDGYKKQAKRADSMPKAGESRGVLLCGDIVPIQKRNGATGAASLWVKEKRGGLIWVLEEIAEDTVSWKLDEDANIISTTGAMTQIWGRSDGVDGKHIREVLPGLPLVDGYAVDKTALESSDDARYYAARNHAGASIPTSVSMDAGCRMLRASSHPHIAGIVVLSASDLSVINSNSVFSATLFGKHELGGTKITQYIPQFDTILDFLTEEDKIALVDGIVVPEHSFRRARALLAVREGKAEAAPMFLRPSGLMAKHRDGSEINIDLQMRVVRSQKARNDTSVIQEQVEDSDADDESVAGASEIVYALWITYSRHLHSAFLPGAASSSAFSRPTTPPHQPSPGQTRPISPVDMTPDDLPEDISPTLSQKIEEAASQPISERPPRPYKVDSAPITLSSPSKTSPKKKKKVTDFVILEDMGQGAYGQVKLARYAKGTGKKVVLKYVTKRRILVDTWTRDRRLGTVPLEIHVLDYLRKDGLRHENIVEMIDFFEDDVNYYIEMVPHGLPGMDLFDYIEMRSTMDEAECKNIFLQVVAALHHLHTKALVVHRDIKDENIVLDGEGRVKLIDFGSAAYIKNGPFDVFVGTIGNVLPSLLPCAFLSATSSSLGYSHI